VASKYIYIEYLIDTNRLTLDKSVIVNSLKRTPLGNNKTLYATPVNIVILLFDLSQPIAKSEACTV
jgi:hypothetical protein